MDAFACEDSTQYQKGIITCPTPNCGQKLGSFSHFGSQCSCGKWVCPAYQIHKSNVDEMMSEAVLKIDIRRPVFEKD